MGWDVGGAFVRSRKERRKKEKEKKERNMEMTVSNGGERKKEINKKVGTKGKMDRKREKKINSRATPAQMQI